MIETRATADGRAAPDPHGSSGAIGAVWVRLCLLVAALLLGPSPARALDPVDPEASPEARALLDYLVELPDGPDDRVVAGQTIHGELDAQYQTYVQGYRDALGVFPGILQLLLYADGLTERDAPIAHRSDGAIFPLSYNHANRGGHVLWLYRPNNPYTGQGNETLIPAGRSFSEVYTPGTDAEGIWREDLQMLALQARRLGAAGIPVTICMFGGYNTAETRWHAKRSNPGATWADFKAAWRHGVQTLRDEGAHNVLWCLEEAERADDYRRRGWQQNWVDVLSIEAAHDNGTQGPLDAYESHVTRSNKPIIYGQFRLQPALRDNPPSYRYGKAVDLVRDSMPRIAAIVPLSSGPPGGIANTEEHSPVFHKQKQIYANDPWMLNRGELDATFGQGRRAVVPVARDPIQVNGPHAENFDDEPDWVVGGKASIEGAPGEDGVLDVFFFGDDPLIKRTNRTMPSRYDRLRVRLRSNSLAERIELSWRRTTDSEWSEERRVSIPVEPMALYLQEVAADLSDHPLWDGTIKQLRLHLNPDHRWGSAEIDYIKFDEAGGTSPKTLLNSGFEKTLGYGWELRDASAATAEIARYDRDARNGQRSLLVFLRDHQDDGIGQDITGVLAENGPGSYRFGAHFRLPDTVGPNREATVRALVRLQAGGQTIVHKVSGVADRSGWTAVEDTVELDWSGNLQKATLILRSVGTTDDLLIDDAFLEVLNSRPVLAPVGDRTVEARQTLTIDVMASDGDGPAPLVLDASPLPGDASFTDFGNGSGRFEWTPVDDDAFGGPYEVTFSATDDGGAGLADDETIEITVTEYPFDGELIVAVSDPGVVTHDLSAAGDGDWKHFGRDNESSVNRKAPVPDRIGNYGSIGSPTVTRYPGDPATRPSVAWSDGTPTASESGTPAGLSFAGEGEGYSLSLPADTALRTARIYLGGANARGRLELTLSDDSGPPYSATIEDAAAFDRVVTVDYQAAGDGQTLELSYVLEEDFGGGTVALAAVALEAALALPYNDGFDAGSAERWSVPVDDTGSAVNWTIANGVMRQTVRVAYSQSFEESYHVGTYRYLVDGAALDDFRAEVTVTPEDATVIDDVGLMFRYRGPDDYYRVSRSARHGYTRLEKRVNGMFSTLGVNAIGYEPGQATVFAVEAIGSDLLVSIDGTIVFAVSDGAHATGSVALYTQDAVAFDDLSIASLSGDPRIAIRRPLAQAVLPGDELEVEVAAFDAPPGAEVVIEVDGYPPETYAAPPYVLSLSDVPAAEYSVTARLLDGPGGNALSTQTNDDVAVGGAYLLALGDSNTNGLSDSFLADNLLVARIRGAQGYYGTLADRLDTMAPFFNIAYNEGISGDTAEEARFARLGSILERHPTAIRAAIGLGTNDASEGREGCDPADATCLADAVGADIQAIADDLDAAGIETWVALVPPVWPSSGPPNPNTRRFTRIQAINQVIEEDLTGILVGPDLFDFFYTDTDDDGEPDLPRLSLFDDRFHFNGLGHHIVALLWYNALIGEATGTSIAPFMLSEPSVEGYLQNLMDAGDEIRVDNFETLTSFPAALAEGIWIMTAQDDFNRGGGDFLVFSVADRPVDVYVAFDASATSLPNWLDPASSAFQAVGGSPVVTSEGSFLLFVRSYAAGDTVTLGGNLSGGSAGADLMYIPIVVDASAP